ncbi:MAG: hypothetical protein H0X13_08865 [Ramlibacter sp.]|nr:hypothetical protein [Ramlibacter sp.]
MQLPYYSPDNAATVAIREGKLELFVEGGAAARLLPSSGGVRECALAWKRLSNFSFRVEGREASNHSSAPFAHAAGITGKPPRVRFRLSAELDSSGGSLKLFATYVRDLAARRDTDDHTSYVSRPPGDFASAGRISP